jgi:LacI family transcriptional regulator
MADIRNPVYAEMARGIQDTAQSYGFMADFGNTDDIPEREVGYVEAARGQRFAGIILISTSGGKELKKALLHLTCPVVLMNRLVKGFPCDTVLLDNESGGAMAAQHLLALGHRKIFHLAGLRRSSASMGRMEGFRRALKSAGVELPADAVEYGNYRVEFGEALGNRLVEAGLPYTAVFAANDLMAIGLLVAFTNRGVRVPDDISVIGFDDMAFAKLSGGGLTTIRQPQYEMGAAAAKMLFERIEDRGRPFRGTVFAPALIERKSCGPPRSP